METSDCVLACSTPALYVSALRHCTVHLECRAGLTVLDILQLSDKQFLWVAMNARSRYHRWNEIEALFTTKVRACEVCVRVRFAYVRVRRTCEAYVRCVLSVSLCMRACEICVWNFDAMNCQTSSLKGKNSCNLFFSSTTEEVRNGKFDEMFTRRHKNNPACNCSKSH